jgi:hypothetical protein
VGGRRGGRRRTPGGTRGSGHRMTRAGTMTARRISWNWTRPATLSSTTTTSPSPVPPLPLPPLPPPPPNPLRSPTPPQPPMWRRASPPPSFPPWSSGRARWRPPGRGFSSSTPPFCRSSSVTTTRGIKALC